MYSLKTLMEKEVYKYNKYLKILSDNKNKKIYTEFPYKRIEITSRKKMLKFTLVQRDGVNGKTIKKYLNKKDIEDNRDLILALANKPYLVNLEKLLIKRLKQFNKILEDYSDSELDDLYEKIPNSRKLYIVPLRSTYGQKLENWKKSEFIGKPFSKGTLEIYTKKDERVRSKSEKIIADMLYDKNIEYKYECPLILEENRQIYPDFTFFNPNGDGEIYWEHFGMMDNEEYANNAIKKIDLYAKSGIYLGQNLIVTFESSKKSIDTKIVNSYIDNYLVRK